MKELDQWKKISQQDIRSNYIKRSTFNKILKRYMKEIRKAKINNLSELAKGYIMGRKAVVKEFKALMKK